MGRTLSFAPGEYYHLYNRGTEKRNIFLLPEHYERFLTLLYLCNGSIPVDLKLQGRTLYEIADASRGETLVDICAYVLMPNHFHLYVRAKTDGGVTRFMRKLGTGYTMYFNTLHERSGALFQGAFKAKHIDTEPYARYLISYIHLNPIKLIEPDWKENGIADRPRAEKYVRNYCYSSYPDYLGEERRQRALLTPESLPTELAPHDFESSVHDWLNLTRSHLVQGETL